MKDNLLLIFVKHPVAGKAKTRLAATLGHEKALEIYKKLLAHTLKISQKVKASKETWYGNQMPENDLWSEAAFARFQQFGEELGDRMLNAFQMGFSKGYKKIIIIGSDNALLTEAHISTAFHSLEDHDVVIGPAKDGGYYLLGMKQAHDTIFHNKVWSTETVFSDTVEDVKTLNLKLKVLEELSDVDVEADLKGTFLETYLEN
ncbi:MAG: TIGR04282 family arsenosugar biosynthesis glycosyltransferase [Bacteroidia bacterium]|nr:TIGR04282 family arsenosugar biosynthesis glycosyltransferase [Bacteroidia bacterium]